jgi:hypothetical protein
MWTDVIRELTAEETRAVAGGYRLSDIPDPPTRPSEPNPDNPLDPHPPGIPC